MFVFICVVINCVHRLEYNYTIQRGTNERECHWHR